MDPLAVFKIAAAIEYAIRRKPNDILKQLLDFHANHLPRPDRSDFNTWFRIACDHRNEAAAFLLIAFAPAVKSMIVRKNLLEAFCCTEAIVKATLQHLNIKDMDAGALSTVPLFMAVRSGRVMAVCVMLKASSNPNLSVASNITSLNKLNVSPLDVALYHKYVPVARCLLQNGGEVPHMSEWPNNRAAFNFLRNWEVEHTGRIFPLGRRRVNFACAVS